jgi:hypothetical protein
VNPSTFSSSQAGGSFFATLENGHHVFLVDFDLALVVSEALEVMLGQIENRFPSRHGGGVKGDLQPLPEAESHLSAYCIPTGSNFEGSYWIGSRRNRAKVSAQFRLG